MKKLLFTIFVASGICYGEETTTEVIPKSGDVVQIGDWGQFVIISTDEFTKMKLTMDNIKERWDKMNENEEGRVALHGKRGHTTITNGMVQVKYADGYVRSETLKSNAVKRDFGQGTKEQAIAEAKKTELEKRLEKIRARRRAALAKTNEVVEVVR